MRSESSGSEGGGLANASQPSGVATRSRWVTRDVKLILVAQLTFGFGWSLYLLTPKYMTMVLHAGPEVIGRVAAIGGITGLLTVPFAARALDRFGRRPFFRVGTLLIVFTSIGFLQVERVGPLLYVLQGCVSAAFVLAFNASAALISDYAPPRSLGQAIGWLGGANVLMNAVATMVGEPLADRYGWPVVFALGIVAGAVAFACSFLVREAPARPAGAADELAADGGAGLGAMTLVLLPSLLMGGVFIAAFSFIQPYAISRGASEVRGFFLGFTASAVVGRVLLGGVGDRFGRRLVSVWMLVGYALSVFVMRELNAAWLVGYGLLFGAAHGMLYPTLNALLLQLMPPSRRGLAMVLYNGAFNLGATLGAFGWGMLASRSGYPAVYSAATAGALIGALLLALGGRRRRVTAAPAPDSERGPSLESGPAR